MSVRPEMSALVADNAGSRVTSTLFADRINLLRQRIYLPCYRVGRVEKNVECPQNCREVVDGCFASVNCYEDNPGYDTE